MKNEQLILRPTTILLLFWITFFALGILNGYGLNLLGWSANPVWILFLVAFQGCLGIAWIHRQRPRIIGEPLALAGFLLSVCGTWIYFIYPALPTLLPPTYSGDAANHLAFANVIYATGDIIADYPAGAALLTATMAHWLGWLPLRVLHPLAALWLALTAGAIYLLTCVLLPERPVSKTAALFAVFALFVPWNYFSGMLLHLQYFAIQVIAQLNVAAFVLFLSEYRTTRQPLWMIAMSFCLLTISVTFQLWLALPVALLAWTMLVEFRRAQSAVILRGSLLVLGIVTLFWIILIGTGGKFVPHLARFGSDGNIVTPSFEELGGAFLLLPVAGAILSWHSGKSTSPVLAFLLLAGAQSGAMEILRLGGFSSYWAHKSFFLLILPLAVFAALPFAHAPRFCKRFFPQGHLSSAITFSAVYLVLAALTVWRYPPVPIALLAESDIDVALWAQQNLDTRHVNYVSRKSVVANWLGIGFWNETYPDDLFVDLARLGPRTFEEWHDTSGWGEYLFVASDQHHPLTPDLRVVYQRGNSLIVQKPTASARAEPPKYSGEVLALADFDVPRTTVRPGETISVTAQIQTQRVPPHRVIWRLQLRDLQNDAAAEARFDPFNDQFPMQRWTPGVTLTQTFALALPVDARPGLYDLRLGLYFVGNGEPLMFKSAEGEADDVIHLGKIKIALPPVTTHDLEALTRADVQLGSAIRLRGYRLSMISPLRPGDSFQVIVNWQCLAPVPDYTAFVHLVASSGILVAQRDSVPRAGTYPTSIWDQDEVVPDVYALTIPRDAEPGDYRIIVGMYPFPSLQRLPVTDAAHRALGDHFELPILLRVE